MAHRRFLQDVDSSAFQVMLGFEKYLAKNSLSRTHADLIKIRVSQINGCAYCIDKHIQDALNIGEDPRRIFVLSDWLPEYINLLNISYLSSNFNVRKACRTLSLNHFVCRWRHLASVGTNLMI